MKKEINAKDFYLDWVNNYLTIGKISKHYQITEEQAKQLIEEGKTIQRLEYLREQIKNECISYQEIAELQGLADHIDKGDVLLLEWAGAPESN